jgi:hypothetical protein
MPYNISTFLDTHTHTHTHTHPVHTTSSQHTDTKHLTTVWLLSSRAKFCPMSNAFNISEVRLLTCCTSQKAIDIYCQQDLTGAMSTVTDMSAGPNRHYVKYCRLSEGSVHKKRTLYKRDSNPEHLVAISHFPSRTPLKSQDSKRLLQSGSFICSLRYRIESSLEKPSFLLVKHSALLSRARRRSSSGRSDAVRSFTKCSHSYVTRNNASQGIALVVSVGRTEVQVLA